MLVSRRNKSTKLKICRRYKYRCLLFAVKWSAGKLLPNINGPMRRMSTTQEGDCDELNLEVVNTTRTTKAEKRIVDTDCASLLLQTVVCL